MMIEYKYKKVTRHEHKKFTENGHTMFEADVLERLKRLAYLEENIKKKGRFYSDEELECIMAGEYDRGFADGNEI